MFLGQAVDVFHQLALEIARFVVVPDASLGQLINFAEHFGQQFFGLLLVFDGAQLLDQGTRRFFVVAIMQTLFRILARPLFG